MRNKPKFWSAFLVRPHLYVDIDLGFFKVSTAFMRRVDHMMTVEYIALDIQLFRWKTCVCLYTTARQMTILAHLDAQLDAMHEEKRALQKEIAELKESRKECEDAESKSTSKSIHGEDLSSHEEEPQGETSE